MPSMPTDARRAQHGSSRDWRVVGAAAATLAVIMGQLVNGFSAFFAPLEAEFGWDRGAVSMANTAGLLGLAIGGIVMGRAADRIGTRAVAAAGIAASALAFAAAAAVQSLAQLYLALFAAGALGGGAVFGPVMALIGRRFAKGAGLAIGLVAAGQAVGQGVVPLVDVLLIDSLGWRGALLCYGVATLALLPLTRLFVAPSATPAQGSALAPVAGGLPPALVIGAMSIAVLGCCTLMSVPLVHLVPLIEGCGIPSAQAGSVMVVMMTVAVGGRVAFGRIADRIGALQAWLIASAWQTLLVFGFMQLGSFWSFAAFAPVYGFGYAGVMTAVLASIRALTPAAHRSTATGCVIAFAWIGHGIGGFAAGALYDLTLDYHLAFGMAALAGAVNLVVVGALLFAARAPRTGRGLTPAAPVAIPAGT